MLASYFVVLLEIELARYASDLALLWALGPDSGLGRLILDFD